MGKRLDLLLVNPASRAENYQKLGDSLAAIEPPIWVGLLATFVRTRGFSVQILDAEAENLGAQEAAQRVREVDPLLCAVVVYGHQPSASTQSMVGASALCQEMRVRVPETKVVLIGGHVSALPSRTLQEEAVDFVCEGEGAHTLVDLLEGLKQTPVCDLSKVRGLWYRDGEVIRANPPAPLIEDLDGLMPGMAWDLLPMEKYRAHNWHCFGHLQREPYASLYTTLGCPYHCTFCCIQASFKSGEKAVGYKESVNSYRFWSPHVMTSQIDTLVNKHNVRNIKLADEMFVLNKRHVTQMCDLIVERGYDLNIWAYARVDTVREGMLDKMKRAGINWLALGIESASEHVRDGALKMYGQNDILRTVRSIQEAGIHVIGNYIFGLPDDTIETMQQTLDLAVELNCEFANFYAAMAYPGSRLYEMAIKRSLPLPQTWGGYSQHAYDSLPLPTDTLTSGKVLRFRDEAFHAYFSNPKYLDMVRKTFGDGTVEHIKQMASHRLERKYAAPSSSDLHNV